MSRVRLLSLATAGDVADAVALVSWLNRPAVNQVSVEIPWLTSSEREDAAARLQRLFNDCGCGWGAFAFLAVLAVRLGPHLRGGEMSWTMLGWAILLSAGAAAGAKMLALAWSRWRLLSWLERLTAPGQRGTADSLAEPVT